MAVVTLDPVTAGLVRAELARLERSQVRLSRATLPVFVGGLRRKYPGLDPETHTRLVRSARSYQRVISYCAAIIKRAA